MIEGLLRDANAAEKSLNEQETKENLLQKDRELMDKERSLQDFFLQQQQQAIFMTKLAHASEAARMKKHVHITRGKGLGFASFVGIARVTQMAEKTSLALQDTRQRRTSLNIADSPLSPSHRCNSSPASVSKNSVCCSVSSKMSQQSEQAKSEKESSGNTE